MPPSLQQVHSTPSHPFLSLPLLRTPPCLPHICPSPALTPTYMGLDQLTNCRCQISPLPVPVPPSAWVLNHKP